MLIIRSLPALACLVLLVALATPAQSTAAAAPPGFMGVSAVGPDSIDFKKMREAKVGAARVLFHFRATKRRKDDFYDWSTFDTLVRNAAGNEIEILPLLFGTPDWIYFDSRIPPIYDERAKSEWSRLLRELASRYGPNGLFWGLNPFLPYKPIRNWQIWNEPNDPTFWEPKPDPAGFAELMRISAAALRSVDPRAKIISGGIIAEPFDEDGIKGTNFLRQTLRQPGMTEAVDAIGYHPYAGRPKEVKRHLRLARRATRQAGARGEPFWVTELGWGSDAAVFGGLFKSEQGQAKSLRRSFKMMVRKRERMNIERALWYYWRDGFDPRCAWCRVAGLLEDDYEPRLAYNEFTSLSR